MAAVAVVGFYGVQLPAQSAAATKSEVKTVTAVKTAENTQGDWTACKYEGAGREYFESVRATQPCPTTIRVASPDSSRKAPPVRAVAMKIGEMPNGTGTTCTYDFGGRILTQAVAENKRCPSSILVR